MKTLKLLLLCTVCFALAIPALAQEEKKAGLIEKAVDKAQSFPVKETCEACNLPIAEFLENADANDKAKVDGKLDFDVFKKKTGPAEGALNHYVYSVEANGSQGMMAQVVNEEKGYAIVMEKFLDGQGEMQTVRFCAGAEKYCKAIAKGNKCDTAVIPQDICYMEEMEAPKIDLGPTLAVERAEKVEKAKMLK